MRSLPSPDLPDEELDGLIDMPYEAEDFPEPAPAAPVRHAEPVSREPEDEGLDDDVEPAHVASSRRERAKAGRPSSTGARTRVTVAIRKDVEAKIRFVAVPAGRMWASTDPICGGTFCQQEPEISGALAEIVCDSPDLLAWFTGPQGKYMKFFNLFMACVPVGMAVYGHHLAHRGEDEEQDPNLPPVDYTQYAA